MMQWQSHQVVIITPRGMVRRRTTLVRAPGRKDAPDDLGLLRDFGWWWQLSQHVGGIQITTSAPLGRKHP